MESESNQELELSQEQMRADAEADRYDTKNLDPAEPIDAVLLEEMERVQSWTNVHCDIIYARHTGTKAHHGENFNDLHITFDRKQVSDLFDSLSQDDFKIAIFFVLAHESVHIFHFHVMGEAWCRKTAALLQEAAADLIAGVWLGLKFVSLSPIKLESITNAVQLLDDKSKEYPTGFQRVQLVKKGYSLGAGALSYDTMTARMREFEHLTPAEQNLLRNESNDLFSIAKRELFHTAPEEPQINKYANLPGGIKRARNSENSVTTDEDTDPKHG